jgi:hypothetical protein
MVPGIPMRAFDPKAGPPSLYTDEPPSDALAALCRHLGRYRARGFVELLWSDEPMWWQEHEWERLRRVTDGLPAYDLAALRALFPRSLVPPATSMRDAEGTNHTLVEALFEIVDGHDALETATEAWLRVQRAHGVAVVRANDVDRDRTPDERGRVLAALDAVAPAASRLEVERTESALVQSVLDCAPLLVDSAAFCNRYDWISDVWIGLTWRGWSEELATWELRHARFGRPQLRAWWYEGGPKVPDYARWRDAWIRVFDESSRRIESRR